MTTFDFSPLFRSTVGFDRMQRLLESAQRADEANGYPPYNIEKLGEDDYRVTMAVAGFGENDLEITQKDNALVIKGDAGANGDQDEQGIEGVLQGAPEMHAGDDASQAESEGQAVLHHQHSGGYHAGQNQRGLIQRVIIGADVMNAPMDPRYRQHQQPDAQYDHEQLAGVAQTVQLMSGLNYSLDDDKIIGRLDGLVGP